jgi:hypothetical protein
LGGLTLALREPMSAAEAMRHLAPILALFGVVVVAGAGAYLAWDLDWRWRPQTITRHQAEIASALQQSGWVSPHLPGPKAYVIVSGACTPCQPLLSQLAPALRSKGVETRMIAVAPADENGQAKSTPQDRAVVAELWANRSWPLFQQWTASAPDKSATRAQPATLPPLPPADGDAGRTALVEASRAFAARLTPLLKDNGVAFAYPTLVWWAKDGRMRARACTSPRTYGPVKAELVTN